MTEKSRVMRKIKKHLRHIQQVEETDFPVAAALVFIRGLIREVIIRISKGSECLSQPKQPRDYIESIILE